MYYVASPIHEQYVYYHTNKQGRIKEEFCFESGYPISITIYVDTMFVLPYANTKRVLKKDYDKLREFFV